MRTCEDGCNGCDECTDYEDDAGRPAEAQKMERARTDAHRALDAAERAWFAYAGMLDVGGDRTRAFSVYENVRRARCV